VKRRGSSIDAVTFALVGLAFARGPMALLRRLRLTVEDQPDLGPLLALLFLARGGVIDRIDSGEILDEVEQGTSRFLTTADPAEAKLLSDWMGCLRLSLAELPGALSYGNRKRWNEVLERWLRSEAPAVESFFIDLLDRNQPAIVREEVFRLLYTERKASDNPELIDRTLDAR